MDQGTQRQPGWYIDPQERTLRRWWDGGQWGDNWAAVDPNEKLTSLAPQQVRGRLLQDLANRGAQVTGQTDDTILGVVHHRTGPNALVVLLLLLFLIVPGVLYLLFGGRNETLSFSISITETGDGTAVVPSGAGAAFRLVSEIVKALPDAGSHLPRKHSA